MPANAGEMRKVATLDEEENKKRAARQARFAAALEDQAADTRTAAKRIAWPGGTMTVVMLVMIVGLDLAGTINTVISD